MTEWTAYTGSDEQIAEMNSADEYITRLDKNRHTEYLICNPHPLAHMICQQAKTGQPVWWKSIEGGGTGLCHEHFPPFAHPDAFEYSFTEFKEEV